MPPRWLISLALCAAALAVGAPSAGAKLKGFQSPSHNIGCYISGQGARCDIKHRSWDPPPTPRSCELDYGFGLTVDRHGRGAFVCAGDTTLGQGRVLPFGDKLERGRFRCSSKRSGIKCVNTRNGHGFKLSRQRPIRF
ncbi:MAG: hypothetical protein GEU88_05065 [Solirubrobacterales bacterium]|nr:hypothetical protein [Solirubrobacterales bacterium]